MPISYFCLLLGSVKSDDKEVNYTQIQTGFGCNLQLTVNEVM